MGQTHESSRTFPQPCVRRISHSSFYMSVDSCACFLTSLVSDVPRAMIKELDRFLRYILEIHEFSREPGCVLRYSIARSKIAVILPGGEAVEPGDPIIELHFWNDRLGYYRDSKLRSIRLRSAFRRSLALLAEQLEANERFADIKAVHATLPRIRSRSFRVRHPFGFSPVIGPRSDRWLVHDFFENFLIRSLRWAFGLCRAKRRARRLSRLEIWFSAPELMARFGHVVHTNAPGHPDAGAMVARLPIA